MNITGVLYDGSKETKEPVPVNVVAEESDDSSGGMNGRKSNYKHRSKTKVKEVELPNLTVYSPPRRDENCRICNTLETKGV